jgi:hypothetical protein
MTKSSYEQRLKNGLKGLAKGKCTFDDFTYRVAKKGPKVCLCGKKGIVKRFMVQHSKTRKEAVVGSKCVLNFRHRKGYGSLKKWLKKA